MIRGYNTKSILFLLVIVSVGTVITGNVEGEVVLHLLDVRKVWDQPPHSAFTDLARYKGSFYLTFREGTDHYLARDGTIRILKSADGVTWTTAATFDKTDFDLRDPKLCIMPTSSGDILMAHWYGYSNTPTQPVGTFVSFTNDGENWSEPRYVHGNWLWRVAWHPSNGNGYEITNSTMHITNDGLNYDLLTTITEPDPSYPEYWPNEATIRFDPNNNYGYILVRRDGEVSNSAILQISTGPPYTEWTWKDLGVRIGGPNLIQLPNGKWIAGGRNYLGGEKTQLGLVDVEQGTYTPLLDLPSGGDTSYPGMVIYDDKLWVSYYSSHEGKAKIYIAELTWEDWEPNECTPTLEDWTLYSQYHFDDSPGPLVDSGPAGNDLTEIGTPTTVTGYSNEALSFVATGSFGQGAITDATGNFDASLGLVVDFWYKGGMDQTNDYPHLVLQDGSWQINFQDNGSMMTLNFSGLDLGAGHGIIYHDLGSNTWDDQWHHYVATYDPVAGIMSGDLDDGTSYVEAAIVSGTINTGDAMQVYIATNRYYDQTYNRGFNGEIDEVKIYQLGAPEPYTLTVGAIPGEVGTVTPAPGSHEYNQCAKVELIAEDFVDCPDTYVFSHWQGDVATSSAPRTMVLMDSDKTVTAVFGVSRECGDQCHPKPAEDLTGDCKVNLDDVYMLVGKWLQCTAAECD